MRLNITQAHYYNTGRTEASRSKKGIVAASRELTGL
jgi:hypothetical protein